MNSLREAEEKHSRSIGGSKNSLRGAIRACMVKIMDEHSRRRLVAKPKDFFAEFVEMKLHLHYHFVMHMGYARQHCRYFRDNTKLPQASPASSSAEVHSKG
jgi:hypothetical protein